MEILDFSYNWNNKLNCNSFTTLRLRNDNKYFITKHFEVQLKGESRGIHMVVDVKHFKITQINEFIARLDTGYNQVECVKLIQTIYKNKPIDWNTQQLSLILLVKK